MNLVSFRDGLFEDRAGRVVAVLDLETDRVGRWERGVSWWLAPRRSELAWRDLRAYGPILQDFRLEAGLSCN